MRISDWSSDVCSSDLNTQVERNGRARIGAVCPSRRLPFFLRGGVSSHVRHFQIPPARDQRDRRSVDSPHGCARPGRRAWKIDPRRRAEEHTSELQLLMRTPYAVLCLKKKTNKSTNQQ